MADDKTAKSRSLLFTDGCARPTNPRLSDDAMRISALRAEVSMLVFCDVQHGGRNGFDRSCLQFNDSAIFSRWLKQQGFSCRCRKAFWSGKITSRAGVRAANYGR
jgi:hypothetical protein